MHFLDLSPLKNGRAEYLHFLCTANGVDVHKYAEIGVWYGETTADLREMLPEAHFYLIDPWEANRDYLEKGDPPSKFTEKYEDAYKTVCRDYGDDPLATIIRKPSIEGAADVPSDLDLVFIDGDHSYEHIKQDILTWKEKVRPGGLLTGHDYSYAFPEVMQAVNELLPGKFIVGKDAIWATII